MKGRRALSAVVLLAASLALGISDVELAHGAGPSCTAAVLNGLYVFSATGYGIPTTGPAQPIAIIELIRFNGDGTLTVPGVALSLNGVVPALPPGEPGTYTVGELNPPERGCVGTIRFLLSGVHLAAFIPLDASTLWLIQTDPTNVLQGTAKLVSR